MNKLKISAIICTYNRCGLLESAITSLINQTLDKNLYEVIVVDNNSTDQTKDVVKHFMPHGNVRYCLEKRQGLSHARNRGWQVARGEYVAYIDDDCKAPRHWLAAARKVIEEVSPGVFGGPYFAFYNTRKPHWFQDCYGSHVEGENARPLTRDEYIHGANIFFRRLLLEQIGGFEPSLGMVGRKLGYGEETALLMRIRATMPDELIYYEPKLYLYHLVGSEKMTMRWLMRHHFVRGRYAYRIFDDNTPVKIGLWQLLMRIICTLLVLCLDIVQGVFKRDRTQYPYLQNYLVEHAFRHLIQLGTLYEQFMQRYKKTKV